MKHFILVGTGGFGRYWCRRLIPSIRDIALPVAAVDINEAALENAAEAGIPEECRYTDIRHALAAHKADFIVLVTPPKFREEYVDLALEAGLDILCEKPLSDSIEGCIRIMRMVKAAGRHLAVTMSHRMEFEKQLVEQAVKSGKHGSLNYICSRLNIASHKYSSICTPENYVSTCLIHNLDTVRAVSGSNAKRVYADCWPHMDNGDFIGMSGLAIVEMENGIRAQLEESFANAKGMDGWSDEYLRAECTGATIIADHRKVTVLSENSEPIELTPDSNHYWGHELIFRDFINWLNGGQPSATSIDDNIQCAALTFATIESIRTGKPVDVQQYLANALQNTP